MPVGGALCPDCLVHLELLTAATWRRLAAAAGYSLPSRGGAGCTSSVLRRPDRRRPLQPGEGSAGGRRATLQPLYGPFDGPAGGGRCLETCLPPRRYAPLPAGRRSSSRPAGVPGATEERPLLPGCSGAAVCTLTS